MGSTEPGGPPRQVLGHDGRGKPLVGPTDYVMGVWSRVRDGHQESEEQSGMLTDTFRADARNRVEELKKRRGAMDSEIEALEEYLAKTGDGDPLERSAPSARVQRPRVHPGEARSGSLAARVRTILEEHGSPMDLDAIIRLMNGAGLNTYSRYFRRNLKQALKRKSRMFSLDDDDVSLAGPSQESGAGLPEEPREELPAGSDLDDLVGPTEDEMDPSPGEPIG